MADIFTSRLFIPFHLADPAGIVFFGHFFTLAHEVYEQWICEHLGLPWAAWFQNEKWIVPIKHAEASYQHPLYAGRYCNIMLEMTSITTSSFTLAFHIRDEDITCCRVKHCPCLL